MKKEYITAAELARRCGVSRQAVYQRMKLDLQSYVKLDNGKKLISTEAEKLFTVKELKQVDRQASVKSSQVDNSIISFLQAQIEEKDKQIAKLQEENEKQAEALRKLATDITEIAKAQQINQAALIQGDTKRLEAKHSGEEAAKEAPSAGEQQANSNFFKRLFKGKSEPQK